MLEWPLFEDRECYEDLPGSGGEDQGIAWRPNLWLQSS